MSLRLLQAPRLLRLERNGFTFARTFRNAPRLCEGYKAYNSLVDTPGWDSKSVSLSGLLDDFRDLQSLERLKASNTVSDAVVEYRVRLLHRSTAFVAHIAQAAERAIYILHAGKGDKVTLSELDEVLPNSNNRAWFGLCK